MSANNKLLNIKWKAQKGCLSYQILIQCDTDIEMEYIVPHTDNVKEIENEYDCQYFSSTYHVQVKGWNGEHFGKYSEKKSVPIGKALLIQIACEVTEGLQFSFRCL